MPELEGHDPVLALGTAELAVLATCWLHLRFLPGEDGNGDGQDWLDPDDLAELLGARLDGTGLPSVLERLARAGYLTLREGQVEAGPLLDTLDEPGAAEQARALVARHQRLAHLRRRAAELDGGTVAMPRIEEVQLVHWGSLRPDPIPCWSTASTWPPGPTARARPASWTASSCCSG